MSVLRAAPLLLLSLSFAAPSTASAGQARPARSKAKNKKKKKKKENARQQRNKPRTRHNTVLSRSRLGAQAQAKNVKSPKLARALERAHRTYQEHATGLSRDPRFRQPHQEAILKAVTTVLRAGTKNVRQGESAQLAAALDGLRAYRNAKLGSSGGIVGSRERIDRDFLRLVPHLRTVFQAAGLPAAPTVVDVSPR